MLVKRENTINMPSQECEHIHTLTRYQNPTLLRSHSPVSTKMLHSKHTYPSIHKFISRQAHSYTHSLSEAHSRNLTLTDKHPHTQHPLTHSHLEACWHAIAHTLTHTDILPHTLHSLTPSHSPALTHSTPTQKK